MFFFLRNFVFIDVVNLQHCAFTRECRCVGSDLSDILFFHMSSLNKKQIEQYLAHINNGERSEDDLEESDAEKYEIFYENREIYFVILIILLRRK